MNLLPFAGTTAALLLAFFVACEAAVIVPAKQVDSLTLEQALDIAEQLQPDLAEARALVEAASGRAQQAGAFPNPAAIARVESARFKANAAGQAEYLAGLSQPIPLGGRLSKAREAEDLERGRRAQELEVRRRNLRKLVHSKFATALYQEHAFQTQNDIAAGAEQVVSTAKARVDAGDARPEDAARAEMESILARIELRRSAALREHAMVELKSAMGDPSLIIGTLTGHLDTTFEMETLEALSANLSGNPEVALAAAEVRERQARLDLAKAERIPDVRVEVLYRRLQGSKENSLDVGLSIPLPFFDRNQGRLREARAEVAAAEARSRSMKNSLNLRLHEAHAQLTTALAGTRALKDQVLPRADLILKASEARFAAGDIGLAELLPIRRDWAAVKLTYLESLRDVMEAWAEVRSHAIPN